MARDMTKGNTYGHLLRFSIPLVLGNMFQLTYNAVDSVIVVRYIGTDAMAAVGTVNPVTNLVILGISGLCIGASVLMSSYFGAKHMENLKRAMATMLILGFLFTVVVVAFGVGFSGQILRLLNVPDDIVELAAGYMRIIFWGMPFTFIYNAYAAAMRSIGDSRTPLIFLAIVSVLNGCLDYLFIAIFQWGVVGAATATVISQGLSALMCFLYVTRRVPLLSIGWRDLRIDRSMMKITIQHGALTALQQSCQPIGKLLIQGSVNSLGVTAMAAFTAVTRVDDFVLLPEQSISHGMMTFVAQNRGAGDQKRMQKGLRQGLTLEFGYWIGACILVSLLHRPIMQLFLGNDLEAIGMGSSYLRLMAFFYLIPAFNNGIQGYCRGLGNMSVTLIATLIQISIRVVVVILFVPSAGLPAVAWASLTGWSCMLIAQISYIIWLNHRKKEIRRK